MMWVMVEADKRLLAIVYLVMVNLIILQSQ